VARRIRTQARDLMRRADLFAQAPGISMVLFPISTTPSIIAGGNTLEYFNLGRVSQE